MKMELNWNWDWDSMVLRCNGRCVMPKYNQQTGKNMLISKCASKKARTPGCAEFHRGLSKSSSCYHLVVIFNDDAFFLCFSLCKIPVIAKLHQKIQWTSKSSTHLKHLQREKERKETKKEKKLNKNGSSWDKIRHLNGKLKVQAFHYS